MLNDENVCIRYLMREMDPSEEVLMERAMMEDEDLLIEVESMRKTLGRLNDLPEKHPSPRLTDSVVQHAVAYRQEILSSTIIASPIFRYTAAAMFALGVTFGGVLAYDYVSIPTDGDAVTVEQVVSGAEESASDRPAENRSVTPWVDRNNVLELRGSFNPRNALSDPVYRNATQKLTPLSDPFFYHNSGRSIQMTSGSAN